jgi:hypothetical protein
MTNASPENGMHAGVDSYQIMAMGFLKYAAGRNDCSKEISLNKN